MKNRDLAQEGKWQARQRQREYKAERRMPGETRVEKVGEFLNRFTGATVDFLIFDECARLETPSGMVWMDSLAAPAATPPIRRDFSRNETSMRSVAASDIGKLDLTCPRRFHKSTFLKSMADMISDRAGAARVEAFTLTSGSSRDWTLKTTGAHAPGFRESFGLSALLSLETCGMPQFKPIEIDWEQLAKMRKERDAADAAQEELLRPVRESLGYGEW